MQIEIKLTGPYHSDSKIEVSLPVLATCEEARLMRRVFQQALGDMAQHLANNLDSLVQNFRDVDAQDDPYQAEIPETARA